MSAQIPEHVDLRKYVEIRLFEYRPHIRDRRIPVAVIAYNARTNQWGVAELAYQFGLSEAEVLAALLYYAEHQDEIDRQEAEERAKVETSYDILTTLADEALAEYRAGETEDLDPDTL